MAATEVKMTKGSKNYNGFTTVVKQSTTDSSGFGGVHHGIDGSNPHITEAYKQFQHRLCTSYQVCERPEEKSIQEIERLLGMKPGNTTQLGLDCRKWLCYGATVFCLCPYSVYYAQSEKFIIPNNHFGLVEDQTTGHPETKLYGPGYHFLGLYRTLKQTYSFQKKVPHNLICSPLGDLMIITVDQGTIALFEYNGQFKIFSPGLHLIRDTMQFVDTIRLDNFYIKVGPEKWITIPDQYDGIAIDNGKTVILEGGKQHHLTHENYKFAKLVPKIILTDRIVTDVPQYIKNVNHASGDLPVMTGHCDPAYFLQTKTKDGSVVYLDTMLFWEIIDTDRAAHKAMNIMELRQVADKSSVIDESIHIAAASRNIDNLRKTVLRFAKSCLSEAVGHVCLTDDEFPTTNVSDTAPRAQENRSMLAQVAADPDMAIATMNFAIQNFLNNKAQDLTTNLNRDLSEFGVRVIKITINDAIPTPEVQIQLDRQAKAKIDRNTALVIAETKRQVAEEQMKTDKIERIGEAENKLEAAKIDTRRAMAEAEAIAEKERIVAQAKKEAAELQESTVLGKQLALFQSLGEASKAFNTGNGEKVYIVGSPLEALTKVAGALAPSILTQGDK